MPQHLQQVSRIGGPGPRWAPALPRPRPAAQTRLLTRLLEEVWFAGHACQCLVASLFASVFAGKREVPPRAAQGGRRAQGYALPARPGCFLQPPFGKKARRTWALRATGASPRQAAQATFAAASPFLEPGPQNGPAHAARRGANLSVSFSRRRNAHFSPPPPHPILSLFKSSMDGARIITKKGDWSILRVRLFSKSVAVLGLLSFRAGGGGPVCLSTFDKDPDWEVQGRDGRLRGHRRGPPRKQDFQPDFWRKSGLLPTPASVW